jgi:hypothetical protein
VIARGPINQSAGILTRVDPPTQIGPGIPFHFVGNNPGLMLKSATGTISPSTLRRFVFSKPRCEK